jgi:hypothetical protein
VVDFLAVERAQGHVGVSSAAAADEERGPGTREHEDGGLGDAHHAVVAVALADVEAAEEVLALESPYPRLRADEVVELSFNHTPALGPARLEVKNDPACLGAVSAVRQAEVQAEQQDRWCGREAKWAHLVASSVEAGRMLTAILHASQWEINAWWPLRALDARRLSV